MCPADIPCSQSSAQVVSITNTGEGKLYGNMDGAETNRAWLSPSLTRRVVSPGQTERVTILAITHRVAPGVHRGYVDFWQVDSYGNGVGRK